MTGQSANVTSLDALRGFRAALVKFGEEVEGALVALDLEGRRPVDWVEMDRTRYWPQQWRKASEALTEARLTLDRCQVRVSSEDPKYCYDERKAVEKAKRRMELAEEKIQATKRWKVEMRKHHEEFEVQIAKARQYLETDLARAIAALDRKLEALGRYVEARRVGEGESGGGGAA
jgi:hypothetical protein